MLVVIESPFAGDIERNIAYARRVMADSLKRGEHPFASHLLYTQPGILNDDIPEDRAQGIYAGYCWGVKADLVAFYVDLGWSPGMRRAYKFYSGLGIATEARELENNSDR